MESLVAIAIAAFTGMSVLTQRLHSRITELDHRVNQVELRVAGKYVTKAELSEVMSRMEDHLIRIEEKMDRMVDKC